MDLVEIAGKVLAILLSLTLALNAYIIKRKTGFWLIPGSVFSLFWFIVTFFPLLFLFKIPVNLTSQLYIVFAVLLFSWSFVFYDFKKSNQPNSSKWSFDNFYNYKRLFVFFYFSVIISIIATIFHLEAQNIHVVDFLRTPIKAAARYSELRYDLKIKLTIFNVIGLLFCYLSVLLGAFVYFLHKTPFKKLVLLACFLPSLFIMITQSAKGAFFLCIFLFLGVYYIVYQKQLSLKTITLKSFKKIILIGFFFFFAIIVSFLSRGLDKVTDLSTFFYRVKNLLSIYLLAHIYSFSDWFNAYTTGAKEGFYNISNNYYGYYTFNAFTRYIPSNREYVRGVFGEYCEYEKDAAFTNVYTFFRGLIMDFGIVGSLVFMFLIGLLVHKFYSLFIANKYPVIISVLLIFTIAYIGTSFLVSLLTWSIIPLTILIMIVFLFLSKRRM